MESWSITFLVLVFTVYWIHCVSMDSINSIPETFGHCPKSRLYPNSSVPRVSMVNLTFIHGVNATNAVCLDGSPAAYVYHPGFGSGNNSWLINLEGGGWCNSNTTCSYRTTTLHGSSHFMNGTVNFTGILSHKCEENPDFFNWNHVNLRYCDGASFAGDSESKGKHGQLNFRGQEIFKAAMEELMSRGMANSKQALLSGCSAGGLASILHCNQFRSFFPANNTTVKCLSDGGFFLDVVDVSGKRTMRDFFAGVVQLQKVDKIFPKSCNHSVPSKCFFPQNLIGHIKTPLFILNAAYDTWQIQNSLVPPNSYNGSSWDSCRLNYSSCNATQLNFFQAFRQQMLDALKQFRTSRKNGLFINSCFSHCQTEIQDTWFSTSSPVIGNKTIAQAVGDWFFERNHTNAIDCPYPCDSSCHNQIFHRKRST